MNIKIVLAFLITTLGTTAANAVPSSASVSGVHNVGWKPGECAIASIGQLVQQRDPAITPAEVIARSGISTQSAWVRAGNAYALVDHPRFLISGERVDVARLFGMGFAVAWRPVGGSPYGISAYADSLTTFATVDDAILRLKELIASGVPVQVHLDTAYLPGYGGNHGSHFVVAHAYDALNVYYCENGGADGTYENIPLSWATFTAAWTEIAHLDPAYPGNECFMLWLTSDPVKWSDDWVLAWLARDVKFTNSAKSPTGPDAIHSAAAAIRQGADGNVAFSDWMRSVYGNWRPYLADYLEQAGHEDLADTFSQACAIWTTIQGMANPDWNTVSDLMDQAADIEGDVLDQMALLADALPPVCLCAPADLANLSTLDYCAFRWAQMPEISQVTLQLAMAGSFVDKGSIGALKPKGTWFMNMTGKDWLKVLPKDGGDRQLSWRVIGSGKTVGGVSNEWDLTWDAQQMTALSPADDYSCAPGELVTFAFSSPGLAAAPCVAISTTGDFNDKRAKIVLKARRGQTSVSFTTKTLPTLVARDDGDGIVYWRVEDASAAKTTVAPSDTRVMHLP